MSIKIHDLTASLPVVTDANKILISASYADFADEVETSIDHALLANLNSTTYSHLTAEQLTDLTDAGDSALHYHATDRARANHTGTQTASTISDFDTEVSNNTDVAANTSARHVAATVADTTSIDLTLTGQQISGVVLPAGVDHDALSNFVADEHVAHTGVTLTAGNGLTGGGDISTSRTFAVGAGTGIAVTADAVSLSHLGIEGLTDPGADRILFWDDTATASKWLTVSTGLNITDTTLTCTITQYTDASARAAISETITGIDYNSTTGVFSLTTGYVIPSTTDWTDLTDSGITTLHRHSALYESDNGAVALTMNATGKAGFGTVTNATNQICLPNATNVAWKDAAGTGETAYIGSDANDDLIFYTNSTARITIDDSTGYVGIGVVDPDTRLEVLYAGTQLKLSYDGTYSTTLGTGTAGVFTVAPYANQVQIYGNPSATNSTVLLDVINADCDIGDMTGIRFGGATATKIKAGIFSVINNATYGTSDLYFALESSADTTNVDYTDAKMILYSSSRLSVGASGLIGNSTHALNANAANIVAIVSDADANNSDDDATLVFVIDGVYGTGTTKGHIGYDQGLDKFVAGYSAVNQLTCGAVYVEIVTGTDDASDTGHAIVTGGGAFAADHSRGASLVLPGNESATYGDAVLYAGLTHDIKMALCSNDGTTNFVIADSDDAALVTVDSNGFMGIGEADPAARIEIKHTYANPYLICSDASINSGIGPNCGVTDDTFFAIKELTDGNGGAQLLGISEDTATAGVQIFGVSAGGTVTAAAVEIVGYEDGGTIIGWLDESELLLQVKNNTTALMSIYGNGAVSIKAYNQAAEPNTTDVPNGCMAFWTDTDDAKCYLCYNHGGTIKTVELA